MQADSSTIEQRQIQVIDSELMAFFKGQIKNLNIPINKSEKATLIIHQLTKLKHNIEDYFEDINDSYE